MSTTSRPLYQQQDPELRRLKEAFVSNLPGTTKWEVFCVLSSLPLCLLTAAYIEARVAARVRSSSQLRKQQWHVPKFVFEFGGAVVPLLLLLMSVAPAEPAFLLLFLLWGSLALKLWMRLAHGPAARQHMAHMLQHMTCTRKRFVSAFRGGVMLATCLAILGVDFPAFPRRYAKAEGYGGGVMDLGVGAIIFAGGLVAAVSAAAAGSTAAADTAAVGATAGSIGAFSSKSASGAVLKRVKVWLLQLLRGIKAAVPLLLLGSAREIATAVVGYQAHLGEYGLNWNFFYTIAAVTLLTLAVPVPPRWLGPLGVALTAAHQLLLSLDLSKLSPLLLLLAVGRGGGGGGSTSWWTAAAAAAGQDGSSSSSSLQHYFEVSMPGLLNSIHSSSSSGGGGAINGMTMGSNDTTASQAAAAVVRQQPGGRSSSSSSSSSSSLGAWMHLELGVEARQAAGFLASNKEGLGSLPGYWALYLLGAAVGHHLGLSCASTAAAARAQLTGSSSSGSGSRPGGAAAAVGEAGRLVWAWVGLWWVVDLLLWGLLAAVEAAVEPVSRRTCNLPYVLWTTAQCLAWLLLVVMADLLTAVICSSGGGCGTTVGGSSIHAPPPPPPPQATASALTGAHGSSGSSRAPTRRSLEAAAAHALPSVEAAGSHTMAAAAAAVAGQHMPRSPRNGLQRRSVGKRGGGGGGGGSSPVAAGKSAAAAAGGGSGGAGAGGSNAAAPAAALDSHHASSREGSPRKPLGNSSSGKPAGGAHSSPKRSTADRAAAGAGAGAAGGGGGGGGGSPQGDCSSSSSSHSMGGSGSAAGGSSGTWARSRRQASRLQQQQHQQHTQQQQKEEPSHVTSSSSSSSGGPMRLMLAFNRNMLALFLLANLLTGAVNLTINTLAVGSWAARSIVGLYMLLLCSIAVLLDRRGITLKLW